LFRKWDKGADINPEDKTLYTTQCQEAFQKYAENDYCPKHQHMLVNKSDSIVRSNLVPFITASGSGLSSFAPYDLSSHDEKYLTPNKVAEMPPGKRHHAAQFLTTARHHLDAPPEATKNCGQITPNRNDYHSDPMEISSTFGSRTEHTGGANKRKHIQRTLIFVMWHPRYSVSYHMVLDWRPVVLLSEVSLAGGSQKPQARPLVKKLV